MKIQPENKSINLTFNDDDPAAQTVIVEGDKAKLPKLTVPPGESFYIGLEELSELNRMYFEAISDMREGTEYASAGLKSKMESGLELAYNDDIDRKREKNKLKFEVEKKRIEALNSILMPQTWRKWIFWKKRNHAQILLAELVSRQAAEYLQRKADDLPSYPGEGNGEELQPFEVVLVKLKERLSHIRKKRRVIVLELIEQLAYGYGSKVDEFKRVAAELEAEKARASSMEERAMNAEELLQEFLEESTPAPEVEEQPEAGSKEPEESAAETDQAEEEPDSNPADDEENDGLSYDGLDEEQEPE